MHSKHFLNDFLDKPQVGEKFRQQKKSALAECVLTVLYKNSRAE